MTQEDRGLLLKDLCARLLYGVKAQIKATNCIDGTHTLSLIDLNSFIRNRPRDKDWYDIVTSIKPYLRPLSNMTEEEWRECVNLGIGDEFEDSYGEHRHLLPSHRLYDWLNKKMFDFRGLIPKGLAIEVTDEFNPYKY